MPAPVIPIFDVPDYEAQVQRGAETIRSGGVVGEVPGPVVLTMAGSSAGGPNLKIESLAIELEGKVDLIFDAGPTTYSKPSTLLKVGTNNYEIVRSGVYDERIIERLLKTT